jgi:kinesin family member C1
MGIHYRGAVPRNRTSLTSFFVLPANSPAQYNETINDLLGHGEFDKKKHEIKHDTKVGTRVTDVQVLPLRSAAQVRQLLSLAQSRRTVAATLMNERSSRSHSVFTLRVTGVNALTGESCAGTLNLVDLAGSERLNASGAGSDKDRLRETQNINKSLSALGDVIAALGEKGEKGDRHIPYRNSKVLFDLLLFLLLLIRMLSS